MMAPPTLGLKPAIATVRPLRPTIGGASPYGRRPPLGLFWRRAAAHAQQSSGHRPTVTPVEVHHHWHGGLTVDWRILAQMHSVPGRPAIGSRSAVRPRAADSTPVASRSDIRAPLRSLSAIRSSGSRSRNRHIVLAGHASPYRSPAHIFEGACPPLARRAIGSSWARIFHRHDTLSLFSEAVSFDARRRPMTRIAGRYVSADEAALAVTRPRRLARLSASLVPGTSRAAGVVSLVLASPARGVVEAQPRPVPGALRPVELVWAAPHRTAGMPVPAEGFGGAQGQDAQSSPDQSFAFRSGASERTIWHGSSSTAAPVTVASGPGLRGIVDEVMRQIERQGRSERQRRGIAP